MCVIAIALFIAAVFISRKVGPVNCNGPQFIYRSCVVGIVVQICFMCYANLGMELECAERPCITEQEESEQ